MKRSGCVIALFFLIAHQAGATELNHDQVPAPTPPYTLEGLRAWHRALNPWPWTFPAEERVHLRGPHGTQVLLCYAGGSRDGEFALFSIHKGAWKKIGDIGQAHHPVHVLRQQVSGWHDFETFLPLWGSGGHEVLALHYRWKGNGYEELSRSEGRFSDYEPFQH